MAGDFAIRQAVERDAAALRALRLRALREHPAAFLISAAEESQRSDADYAELLRTRWGAPDNQILVAERDGALTGMTGFFREAHAKVRHRATIWGVYVTPEARGTGAARALLRRALDRLRAIAEITDVQLAVGTYNTAARRCYEAVGFRTWGIEPRTMLVDGRAVDEAHMALSLRDAPPGATTPE